MGECGNCEVDARDPGGHLADCPYHPANKAASYEHALKEIMALCLEHKGPALLAMAEIFNAAKHALSATNPQLEPKIGQVDAK